MFIRLRNLDIYRREEVKKFRGNGQGGQDLLSLRACSVL